MIFCTFLQHQLNNNNANAISDSSLTCASSSSEPDLSLTNKIIDDFEWVLNSVHIGNKSNYSKTYTLTSRPPTPTASFRSNFLSPSLALLQQFPQKENCGQNKKVQLTQWLQQKLHQSILFVFLQYLVSDKELLEEHYTSEAVLRQEEYVNALFIGMSSFETHQCGLLKQIDILLKHDVKSTQHKRSNSQPNVIILPATKKSPGFSHLKEPLTACNNASHKHTAVFLTIRKTKSLPEIKPYCKDAQCITDSTRPRCKTIADIKLKRSRRIPQVNVDESHCRDDGREIRAVLTLSSGESSYGDEDQQPSTSRNSTSNRNKMSTSSLHLNSTASTASSSSMCTSVSSSSSTTTTKHIQLINTDDIKIWTDHVWEKQKKKHKGHSTHGTPAQAIPSARHLPTHKSSKSLSPLNSFFSSLFSTPPSYTSWYTDHGSEDESQMPETAIDSINPNVHVNDPCSNMTPTLQSTPSSLSSVVLDKFLPIYGKKLRSRNSQNLFEDASTALDYSTPVDLHNLAKTTEHPADLLSSSNNPSCSPSSNSTVTTKNSQSLTRFLQMSQASRNNTQLEKENAHFRISEAIISAIEHIKWNKQTPLSTQSEKLNREGE